MSFLAHLSLKSKTTAFNEPLLRQKLLDLASKCFIYIDETNPDEVLVSEFSDEAAKGQIATFKTLSTLTKTSWTRLALSIIKATKIATSQEL